MSIEGSNVSVLLGSQLFGHKYKHAFLLDEKKRAPAYCIICLVVCARSNQKFLKWH